MSLKKIDAKIKTFSTNRAKLQALGHEIAMMIFRHAAPKALPDCVGSGDVTRILKLAAQMPTSWQVQLNDWCKQFTPIRFNVKNQKAGFDPEYKKVEDAEERLTWWKLEEANETPFYELTEPDAETMLMDFDKLMALVPALAKRIQKKIDEGQVQENAVEAGQRMVIALQSLKIERPKAVNDKYDTLPEEAAA